MSCRIRSEASRLCHVEAPPEPVARVMVMDSVGGEAREVYRPGSMLHGLTFTYVDGHLRGEVWVLEDLMADVSGR